MYEDRIKFITHKGKRILILDYSNLTAEQLFPMLPEVLKAHRTEAPGSMLCCLNVENLHFSPAVVSKFNALIAETKVYLKASAVVGTKGLVKVMYDAVTKFTKLDLKIFNEMNAALDWLSTF